KDQGGSKGVALHAGISGLGCRCERAGGGNGVGGPPRTCRGRGGRRRRRTMSVGERGGQGMGRMAGRKVWSKSIRLVPGATASGSTQKAAEAFPKAFIYPFFLFHMLTFGVAGFLLAYGAQDAAFVYLHGGIAIIVYLVFYLVIFGRYQV